ncbi:MAG: hypothetical protein ACHQQR_00425 [Gemmatimonadales bacterium]|jgi:hypothetical protein
MAYRVLPALNPLVRRGIGLCVLARLLVAVAMAMAVGGAMASSAGGVGPTALHLRPVTALAFAALCGALIVLDAARRREIVLFANLGIGVGTIALCAALPAIALEALIALVAGL